MIAAAARLLVILAALWLAGPWAGAETLNVAKGGPQSFSFAPVDIALSHGFLQKRGLDAKLSNFDGATKVHQAIASGDIDIALASGPDMAFIVKGSPATTVAAMAGRPNMMALEVAADSPIKRVADLKGKIISVTSAGSLTNWLAHELSRQQGWGPDGIKVRGDRRADDADRRAPDAPDRRDGDGPDRRLQARGGGRRSTCF